DPLMGDSAPLRWFIPVATAGFETAREVAWERRGEVSITHLLVQTAAPFGLFRVRRILHAPATLTVFPRWYPAPADRSTAVLTPDSATRPRAGSGGAFLGTREYRTGDPLRAVHWRSSLRRGKLVVKEFEDLA